MSQVQRDTGAALATSGILATTAIGLRCGGVQQTAALGDRGLKRSPQSRVRLLRES